VLHPLGWEAHQLELPETLEKPEGLVTAYALSPASVDLSTLDAFFAGEATPPIFLMIEVNRYLGFPDDTAWQQDLDEAKVVMLEALTPTQRVEESPINANQLPHYLRYMHAPRNARRDEFAASGVLMVMLATEEDWDENGATYKAMLHYARSYQYYTHPEMRHTLFLNSALNGFHGSSIYPADFIVRVPYPDGWLEETLSNGDIQITSPGDSGAIVHIYVLDNFPDDDFDFDPQPLITTATELGLEFDEDALADMYCGELPETLTFNREGRQGYLRIAHYYIIEISAPESQFAQHEDLLRKIIEGIQIETRLDSTICE
jgi:hypothetical protein